MTALCHLDYILHSLSARQREPVWRSTRDNGYAYTCFNQTRLFSKVESHIAQAGFKLSKVVPRLWTYLPASTCQFLSHRPIPPYIDLDDDNFIWKNKIKVVWSPVTIFFPHLTRDSSRLPFARILITTGMSEPSSSQHRVTSVYRDIQYLIPPIHCNIAITPWEEN